VHRYPVKDVSEGGPEKHHLFGVRPLAGQGLMYLLNVSGELFDHRRMQGDHIRLGLCMFQIVF
jgi:hypothetical protein